MRNNRLSPWSVFKQKAKRCWRRVPLPPLQWQQGHPNQKQFWSFQRTKRLFCIRFQKIFFYHYTYLLQVMLVHHWKCTQNRSKLKERKVFSPSRRVRQDGDDMAIIVVTNTEVTQTERTGIRRTRRIWFCFILFYFTLLQALWNHQNYVVISTCCFLLFSTFLHLTFSPASFTLTPTNFMSPLTTSRLSFPSRPPAWQSLKHFFLISTNISWKYWDGCKQAP